METDVIYTILTIVIPLVELLGILAAVHAIMNARTSQGAIAWAISLVTFPWLALAGADFKIYFLYDEIGSHKLSQSFLRDMQIAGVVTSAFHSTKGKTNRFQLNFRNHRKIVIVDGKVAWVGGHNVGDEYIGKNTKLGAWRDTHVKIEGPAVQAIQ